jgi:ribosomal protein S18 acetylase RimI-like enzyme
MAKAFVLRMRRDLTAVIETPVWPAGFVLRTLGVKPDKALVTAAHSVLEAGFWEGGGGAPIFRQWWKALRTDREFDPALIFLAVDSEGVAGMAQCWTSAFVKDLAVHPRAQRHGVGRALMLTVFQVFAIRGAAHVELKVREENANALALYRSLGMTVSAREPG